CFNIFTQRKSRRYPVARCQGGKLDAAAEEECIASDEEGIRALAFKRGKGRIDLADRTGVKDLDLQSDGGGGFVHGLQCGLSGVRIDRIDEHSNTNGPGHHVMQEPQPLGRKRALASADPVRRNVTTGSACCCACAASGHTAAPPKTVMN